MPLELAAYVLAFPRAAIEDDTVRGRLREMHRDAERDLRVARSEAGSMASDGRGADYDAVAAAEARVEALAEVLALLPSTPAP